MDLTAGTADNSDDELGSNILAVDLGMNGFNAWADQGLQTFYRKRCSGYNLIWAVMLVMVSSLGQGGSRRT